MIEPISAFQHAPMLDHVCLEAGMHPSDLILPWAQLTSVELYGASADDCLELLSLAKNITGCVLDVQYASHALSPGPPLASLHFFTLSGPAGWGILRYITMPALQVLDLTRSHLDTRNFSQVLSFISRSKCELHELRLYVRNHTAAETIHILQRLPSLTKIGLTFVESDSANTLLRQFELRLVFLPRLESLYIHCVHGDDPPLNFSVITNALRLRSTPSPDVSSLLSSFSLTMEYDAQAPDPEIHRRWRELAAQGVEMCIKTPRERWI
ncbi:hypothetical protein C8J57DRAFT_1377920 [Mycena rebaudengoi]|nr:hypothetical protein C8J57DRAFT_1377920 [Mycena rebaudengoi]